MIVKILKFGGEWCAPCRLLKEELKDFTLVPIEEINIDENEELCEKYKVRNIPLLVFLDKDDVEVNRNVGFIKKADLEERINKINGNV